MNTELTLSAKLRVGLSHDFNGQLTGHLSWGWENWSEMDEVFISGENGGAALDRKWDDTYHYAVGVDYRAGPRWTYRAGVSYDDSPVDAGDRTADLSTVSVPTLVVHGDEDPLMRIECGQATAKAIPGATLKIIKGMGHALPESAWAPVIDAIVNHAVQ